MQNSKDLENLGLSAEEAVQDLHRPYIDKIILECSQCGSKMKRVPEVLDAWFDSGAMPFAQYHYPFDNDTITVGNHDNVIFIPLIVMRLR